MKIPESLFSFKKRNAITVAKKSLKMLSQCNGGSEVCRQSPAEGGALVFYEHFLFSHHFGREPERKLPGLLPTTRANHTVAPGWEEPAAAEGSMGEGLYGGLPRVLDNFTLLALPIPVSISGTEPKVEPVL